MQQCQLHLTLLHTWLLCSLFLPSPFGVAVVASAAAATAQPDATTTAAAAAAAALPAFCQAAAYPNAGGPSSMVWGGNMLKVYRNLYVHNKKWYAVLDASSSVSSIDAGISLNTHLIKLPTTDTQDFQVNTKVCYVPGVTLLLDFPFPAFPDNLGHWAELLIPLYSALSSSSAWRGLLQGQHSHIDRLLLVNVRQQLLYNWPREVLGLALAPALPPWPTQIADSSEGQASDSSSSGSGGASIGGGVKQLGWHEVLPWERPLPAIINPVDYEAWSANGWLVFENVMVLQDRYPIVSLPDETRPPQPRQQAADSAAADPAAAAAAGSGSDLWASQWVVGFNQPHLAAQFRSEALARHFWDRPLRRQPHKDSSQQQQQQQQGEPPAGQCRAEEGGEGSCAAGAAAAASARDGGKRGQGVPHTVTVLWYPEDYPPVTNHLELVRMLEELTEPYGFKVRVVSLTMGAPFLSHMATMADTGLLVGRHGPLLASAVLLPPGAAVLELLPYKWEWQGVSRLYYNMTQSTGQLHHWAWRPLEARWCRYKQPSDARYAGWLATECQGRDCLLVHAQAGLEVDLAAVRQLLARKLPGLVAGESVEQLREPWPAAE